MSDQAYFDQIEQNINSLLAENKFKEAYNTCLKYLNLYPDVKQLHSIKERIEEEIQDYNSKYIAKKIEEAKALISNNRYADALKTLNPLLEVSPENSKLRKLIKKAQEKYKEQIEANNKRFIDQQSEVLNKILKENPDQLIPKLLILEQNNRGSKLIDHLSQVFRDKLIEAKIKSKRELLNSNKYKLIHQFLNDLDKIQENNPRVKEVRDELKVKEHSEQTVEKNDFIYRSQKQLTTLIQLKKYDKAMKVAKEILSVDSKNKKILKLLENIKEKHYQQTKELVIDQMQEAGKNLEALAKSKPKEITKI